jgi:hypothetical protein
MATSTIQQQSVTRKFIYFGLIIALFSVSLIHRKNVLADSADRLQMREVGHGKADLTDSALRLTLSGVRGVAVTSLWLAAIEKQKRHEWNELEVCVDSLTRLQPRFTSPWLFQSWNLAFNVAVECDRPRDKYYYVTRGIRLLSQGEEKNDPGQARPPQPWPANPEMRFNIGFYYQLKVAQVDEKNVMNCLFDMSCIPLAEREPNQFYKSEGGKQIDMAKFKAFCEAHPRLVRRLRKKLSGYEKPEAIVQFLADNKDVPTRIEDRTKLTPDSRLAEFPILPPQDARALEVYPYPDWEAGTLGSSSEDFDVYVCVRAWSTYAQVPLPPANPDPSVDKPEYAFDRLKHRQPKMATVIFRGHPARSQAYHAEKLQTDGWFDEAGWDTTDDFPALARAYPGGVVIGKGARFDSAAAWSRAYQMYKDYGSRNGMFFDPAGWRELELQKDRKGPGSPEAKRYIITMQNKELTQYDQFLFQAQVERTPEAVAARKAIFQVEVGKADDPSAVKIFHDQVLPQWLDLLLRYPEFRQVQSVLEETYELQAKYFRLLQHYNRQEFEKLVTRAAVSAPLPLQPSLQAPLAPCVDVLIKETIDKKNMRLVPIRDVEGTLDQLFLLNLAPKEEAALKPLAEALARQVLWPPPPADPKAPDFAFARYAFWSAPAAKPGQSPEVGLGQQSMWPPPRQAGEQYRLAAAVGVDAEIKPPLLLLLSSAEQRRIPTQLASHRQPPTGQGWSPLIPLPTVMQVRDRINWMRPRVPPPPQAQ